ncbi:MAG: hypothetical protein MZV70_03390 [Desulfobacterales bacterium]|nr:hypothetical protein [Desulfobacterales bacterium]
MDDEAIVNELEGRLVESAVYHFTQQGKELWGLGKTGVDSVRHGTRQEGLHYP